MSNHTIPSCDPQQPAEQYPTWGTGQASQDVNPSFCCLSQIDRFVASCSSSQQFMVGHLQPNANYLAQGPNVHDAMQYSVVQASAVLSSPAYDLNT